MNGSSYTCESSVFAQDQVDHMKCLAHSRLDGTGGIQKGFPMPEIQRHVSNYIWRNPHIDWLTKGTIVTLVRRLEEEILLLKIELQRRDDDTRTDHPVD